MKKTLCLSALAAVFVTAAASLSGLSAVALAEAGQTKPQTYKGLEFTVNEVTRARNVSLTDCPPGANTQRGVIRPGEETEFAAVKVDFKVLPAFKPGPLPKPVVYDDGGKSYNTAQAFADIGSTATFTCTFAFRVPKGAKLTKFAIDSASFELPAATP